MNRRSFLVTVGAAGCLAPMAALASDKQTTETGTESSETQSELSLLTSPGDMKGEMLYRQLGGTGSSVSVIGLGGHHIGQKKLSDADAIRLMHEAIDRGITFMDNCWDYNQGQSEIRMGSALEGGRRDKVFLMTKIDGRTKELAAQQINESLQRLKTDRIDLMMHHEIIRYDDCDRIFAPGGAQEAILEAQKAGKIKFTGFTGHKDPRIHLYMLELAEKNKQKMDAVLMPINVLDAHFRSFARLVLPVLHKQNIGILGMKSFGGANAVILKSKIVTPQECLQYALSLATTVVTGIDRPEILAQAFEVTKSFKLMDKASVDALLAKTKEVAMTGKYELFKTSALFDATARHHEWLGGNTSEVQNLAS